jgi:hypothetical protein
MAPWQRGVLAFSHDLNQPAVLRSSARAVPQFPAAFYANTSGAVAEL